jgi:hypothetical protein
MTVIRGVKCYGVIEDNSNFELVCDDEDNDMTWCEGNPLSDDYTFSSWEEVVNYFLDDALMTDIVEITAV